MISAPDGAVQSNEHDGLKPIGRRGRARNSPPAHLSGKVIAFPVRSNPNDWLHRHFDRKHPLNWEHASVRPALGRAILDAVHGMSGPDQVIATGSTALAYQIQAKPFFEWLNAQGPDASGRLVGATSTHISPRVLSDFKRHIDLRVQLEEISSQTGYHYKGAILRILRSMFRADAQVLGPGWREEHFINDDFNPDGKAAEPYSRAEAHRIIARCAATISSFCGTSPAVDQKFAEVAAYVIMGIKLGIEPECIQRLTIASVRVEGSGRFKVRYIKPRGGGGNGFRKTRVTNPTGKTADPTTEVSASGSTFKDGAGVLSFLRDAARRRAEAAGRNADDEPLFTTRCDASALKAFSDLLHADGLLGDDGQRLAILRPRLRPTWRSERHIRHKGRISIDRNDNTPDVRSKHYLENDRLRPFYEDAVIAAADEALSHALRPRVVDLSEKASEAEVQACADLIGASPSEVSAAMAGDTDLWLASCRDFTNSPYSKPGKPCPSAFHGCVTCRNALITRRSLPALLAFKAHIEARRADMPDGEWKLVFGRAHREIVEAILPKFHPDVVAEATVIARGSDLLLHLPPEMLQ